MANIKPIKRSPQLAALSREHHDGLLFVWKIRQGLKNETPIDQLRNYTRWYWKIHIKPHFFEEEKILIPCMPADNLLIRQMKREHDMIRELVITVDKDMDAEKQLFITLVDLIERHIRFEERELFGLIETTLTPAELAHVQQQLELTPPITEEWTQPFWVNKKN